MAVVNFFGAREDLRAGSKEEGGAPVRVTKVAMTYTATYRIENRAGDGLVVTTEKYWVRRPFDSKIESWRGAPPGTSRLSVRYSNFAAFATEGGTSRPLHIAVPPGLASGDLRIDAVLSEVLRDRTVIRRERRSVYGRSCQVYRFGGPVSAGDVTPYKPGIGEYADVCIDGNGIVLEEAWTSKDKLIQRRAVTTLAVNVPIDDDEFGIRIPASGAELQGQVERITPGDPIWTLSKPPAGFRSLGVFAVAVPSVALPQSPSGMPSPPVASVSEVFVNGPDLLVVDQGASLAAYIESDDRPARPARISALRDGELVIDARMSEVRGRTSQEAVRVFGSLHPSGLIELARSIVKK